MKMARRLASVLLAAGLLGALGLLASGPAQAAPREWAALTAEQRQALAPLQREWPNLEEPRRAKWLEVAARFRTMPADERQRIQARMAEWARMSPAERNHARLQFQETRQLPPDERQAQWQAFQSLSDEQRRELSQRAAPKAPKPGEAVAGARSASPAPAGAGPSTPKRNVVQTAGSPPVRAIGGATAQAKPGATTSPITARAPLPPAHHQAGLPKIAATPGFVDPSTLLPRRGPQGAAAIARTPASADPAVQP